MRKPPQSSALGPTVAESLTAAIARKQAARQGPAPAAAVDTPGLLGAYREVLEHESQKAVSRPERMSWWHRVGRPLAGACIVLTAGWLWILPPDWLQPAPAPPVAWPVSPGGNQLLLINTADAIVLFQQTTGRLPAGAELDSVAARVSFHARPDGGFDLRAPDGSTLIAPPPGSVPAGGYELVDAPGAGTP